MSTQDIIYTPVSIRTLKPELEIPFNVFIFFKGTYIKYIYPNSKLETAKFKKLKKQKMVKFFIPSEEEQLYQDFLDQLLSSTLNDPKASIEDKANIASGQAENAFEKMKNDPGSQESYNLTTKAAKGLQQLIFNNPEALKEMFSKEGENDKVVQHTINVTILGLKLAKKLELGQDDIDNLSIAALMHDIGISKLPEETQKLFETKKNDLDSDQKKSYNEHCIDFIELLKDKPYINDKVILLIKHHEENKSGSGPHKHNKLTQTEEILSLVDCYDKKIITEKLTPKEAIKNLTVDEMGNYDLSLITSLQTILKEDKII